MNLKLYLYLGCAIALGLLLWRFEYLSSKVTSQQLEIDQGVAREAAYALNIERKEKQITQYAINEKISIKTIEDGINETNRIRKCIDDGTCILRIRTSCPSLPKTSADSGTLGTSEPARLDAGLEQDILNFKGRIAEITAHYQELYDDCSDIKNP